MDEANELFKTTPTELKPYGFFVTLKYRCPHCGRGYFRTVEETQDTAALQRCKCGALLSHKPVASLDIKIKFQGSARTETGDSV